MLLIALLSQQLLVKTFLGKVTCCSLCQVRLRDHTCQLPGTGRNSAGKGEPVCLLYSNSQGEVLTKLTVGHLLAGLSHLTGYEALAPFALTF